MLEENLNAQAIIERISAAYGVTSQKALAEALDVPANNISTWLQRDSIPYKAIVKCVLDTEVSLNWLVKGEFANAKSLATEELHGKSLYEEILSTGGRPVLRRILEAYGFQMQKELGDLLDISSGTISTWVRREFFPGDVVVACALDTGVSLRWLATGKGDMFDGAAVSSSPCPSALAVTKFRLESGELKAAGEWMLDASLAPSSTVGLIFVQGLNAAWLVDTTTQKMSNGRWLISIDEAFDIFDVVRLPGGKVRLTNTAADFECNVSDIVPSGLVTLTLEKHV